MLPVERTSSSNPTAAAQGGQTSATGTHRVERGDTLSDLAQRYGTTVQAFMKANPQIRDADLILTGDTLNVPTARDQASTSTGTHRIERGDTLSDLAQRYNTTVSDFLKANPQIRDPDRIYAGDTLNVPKGGSSSGGAGGPGGTGGTGGAGPTAPTGQPGEPLPQGSRAKEAMDYFIGQGWTREQAAGIVANLQAESNFKADAVGDGGQAYGIAQWHPDRQANFQKFAGHSIRGSTFEEQLKFVQWELTNTEKAAGNQLRAADTAREAGGAVSKYYERPADREGEATRRGARAEQILGSYRPDAPATGGPPQTSGSLVKPVDAKLPPGSEFSMNDPEGAPDARGGRHHAAKDWFAPAGSAVRAPVDGTIVEVRQSRGNSGQVFGGTVKVEADNGQVWVFRHVDPAKLSVGQKVDAGTQIARVTDWASGPDHTHVELWKSLAGGYRYENMIDPMTVLKRFA